MSSSPCRGSRVSIVLTVVRITPWQLQRKILLCIKILFQTPFLRHADHLPSGIVAFFVLRFVVLTTQIFWVCEFTYTGWKEIPGLFCLVPQVVPISLVISKSPPSLATPFVFYKLDFQQRSFRMPSRSLRPCWYDKTPTSTRRSCVLSMISDPLGCSHSGVAFPLVFYLLHVDCNYADIVGTRCLGDGQARCLGGDFRYANPRSLIYTSHSGPQLTCIFFFSLISGGVEAAVSIAVCNMSVIIPAILCALGVGDPFMREDTVSTNFSTVEVARMTSTRVELVELGIPKSRRGWRKRRHFGDDTRSIRARRTIAGIDSRHRPRTCHWVI